MMLFADNPSKFLTDYSRQFKSEFMKILSRSHGTKRVHANLVYQEYIADKTHVHMNATCWNSLNGFCRTMASQGLIEFEETEKGPFITWIDSSPENLARQEAILKKQRLEKTDEERNARLLAEQIEKAAQSNSNNSSSNTGNAGGISGKEEYTELIRPDSDQPLKMKLEIKSDLKGFPSAKAGAVGPAVPKRPVWATANLGPSTTATVTKPASTLSSSSSSSLPVPKKPSWANSMNAVSGSAGSASTGSAVLPAKRPMSAMEELMEQQKKKASANPFKRPR